MIIILNFFFSTPMMDLLVQITTAHKLAASSYTLQAIGERSLVLPHQPNTPIGALDALQVNISTTKKCFSLRIRSYVFLSYYF